MVSFRVIVNELFADGMTQRIFAEEDHSVQAVFFDGAYESFGESVQVRRGWGQLQGFDSRLAQRIEKRFAVERIAIMNKESISFQESVFAVGQVAGDLIHPESVWILGDYSKLDASAGKLDEEKDHETLKFLHGPDFNRKEIRRGNLVRVT